MVIIVYRDGVNDRQLDLVLNDEVNKMKVRLDEEEDYIHGVAVVNDHLDPSMVALL